MTVEIIKSNGHITIHCDEGDDFLPAYLQVINETEIVCSNCGSYNIRWAIEEINERIEMVESNQKQLESNGDTSDDISRLQCMKMAYETGLSLRKPEDATK